MTRVGRGAAGALDTYANNSSSRAPKGASDLREWRYKRRALLRDVSSLRRVCKCGRVLHDADHGAGLRLGDGGAGWSGVVTCGSVWVCPVCNAKVMARRALELGTAIAAWQARGGTVVLVTFTMRHRLGQGLVLLWDSLSYGWARVTSGTSWLRDKGAHGVVHYARTVEVTTGRNGWHVHAHVLLFLHGKVADGSLSALHGGMFGRWRAAMVARGLAAPTMAGQDIRVVGTEWVAEYLTKSTDRARSAGREVTMSQGKRARSVLGTEPTWVLLDRVSEGDADALDLWHEWERGSKGRRQITWSRGARQDLGLTAEQTDEEIAEQEHGGVTLLYVTADGWRRLLITEGGTLGPLVAAEAGGMAGARAYLEEHGIEFETVDREGVGR